jgi:intraflagellar transport protein 81
LRKQQDEEAQLNERLREQRQNLQETENKLNNASQRLMTVRNSGIQNQSAEQLLSKLQKDVKDLHGKKEAIDSLLSEKLPQLDRLQSWESSDRIITDDDVAVKREQVRGIEEENHVLQSRLDSALERNPKLTVFRQASSLAQKKMREREDESEKLAEEKRRLMRTVQEKENERDAQNSKRNTNKLARGDRAKFMQAFKEKNELHRRMKDEPAGACCC